MSVWLALGTLPVALLPLETEEFDPNTVTPGVIGFLATFGLAVIVVLLVLDMVRRVRRVRYREEIAEQLDAEEAEAAAIARAESGVDDDRSADDRSADDRGSERP